MRLRSIQHLRCSTLAFINSLRQNRYNLPPPRTRSQVRALPRTLVRRRWKLPLSLPREASPPTKAVCKQRLEEKMRWLNRYGWREPPPPPLFFGLFVGLTFAREKLVGKYECPCGTIHRAPVGLLLRTAAKEVEVVEPQWNDTGWNEAVGMDDGNKGG